MVHLHTKFRFSSFSGLKTFFFGGHYWIKTATLFNVFLNYRDVQVLVHLHTNFRFSSSSGFENAFLSGHFGLTLLLQLRLDGEECNLLMAHLSVNPDSLKRMINICPVEQPDGLDKFCVI